MRKQEQHSCCNVRPKIRQQLQALRDHGWLEVLGGGRYRLS